MSTREKISRFIDTLFVVVIVIITFEVWYCLDRIVIAAFGGK